MCGMSRICLIRHGKTEANEKHLYCGSTDLPLSKRGAEELREKHYDIKNVRFLTSGMKRTEQTLEILFGPVPHTVEPRFREVDFGKFEMHSYEQLKNDPDYQQWITGNNETNIPPQGESGEAMTRRVLEAFHELADREEDTVLITHGGVIAAIMADQFPGENKNRYQWQPKPGEGYVIESGKYAPLR